MPWYCQGTESNPHPLQEISGNFCDLCQEGNPATSNAKGSNGVTVQRQTGLKISLSILGIASLLFTTFLIHRGVLTKDSNDHQKLVKIENLQLEDVTLKYSGSPSFASLIGQETFLENVIKKNNKNFKLNYIEPQNYPGSKIALKSLRRDEIDIAHVISDRLYFKDYLEKNDQIIFEEVASGDYVIIVNLLNPINEISESQVKDIFSGDTQNWFSLNGLNKPIKLYGLERLSGEVDVFERKYLKSSLENIGASYQPLQRPTELIKTISNEVAGITFLPKSLTHNLKQVKVLEIKKEKVPSSSTAEHDFILLVAYNKNSKKVKGILNYIDILKSQEATDCLALKGLTAKVAINKETEGNICGTFINFLETEN